MKKVRLFLAVLTISIMSCGMIATAAEPAAKNATEEVVHAVPEVHEDNLVHGLGTFVKTHKSVIVDGYTCSGLQYLH